MCDLCVCSVLGGVSVFVCVSCFLVIRFYVVSISRGHWLCAGLISVELAFYNGCVVVFWVELNVVVIP